ncbi:hypothetical protein ACFOJE_03845 [Azotobacter bryophylli]|uniref:Uncharacterized protein n=1 Tax=Azotobacter bryophylli TaxID=1986537 RepID=A0ABV7AQH0_9GAMM
MSRSAPIPALTKPNRPDPAAHLVALLAAERAHATRAWTILSELRLHGVLPDWARQAGAGSYDVVTGQNAARQALNDALAAAVPGFREALQSALGIPRLTRAGD